MELIFPPGKRELCLQADISLTVYADDIKKKVATKRKAAPKSTAPREVSLDFETLPVDLQVALASEARKQLKKSRINYDHRDKAGAVSWRIDCRVERPG